MIKIWEFDFNAIQGRSSPDYNDAAVVQRAYDNNLHRLAGLESLGFEGVFFSEHHFLNSLTPCPNLLVAALAKMTQTMRIGVMGNVVPMHQPWRLAEEIAMLDYITGGRFEIGSASGIAPEYMFINIADGDIRPMYAEALEFLDKARDNKMFSHEGKYWNFDDIIVMPRRKKMDRRREWMTIYTGASAEMAARRDAKVCTGYQSTTAAAKAFEQYRETAANLGRDVGPDDIGLRRQVLVCDSDSQAKELNEELLAAAIKRMEITFQPLADRLAKATGQSMPEGIKQSGVMDASTAKAKETFGQGAGGEKPKGMMSFVHMEDEFIFGSPQTVADRIIAQCREAGVGNLMAYHASTLEEAELDTHYALWGKVLPILAKASLKQAVAA